MTATKPNALACALRCFFVEHLPKLRGMSPHTVHSYRDSISLLLRFVAERQHRSVVDLDCEDISAEQVAGFLHYLEDERRNSSATRNVRLAAIHAFFRFVASGHPDRLEQCQRILGVPFKRTRSRAIEYFEYDEMQAVLSAVNRTTADGRRDYALISTMFNTGARVQEILDLRPCDLQLEKPCHARLIGKGRKERLCPLWPQTAQLLKGLLTACRVEVDSRQPLFRNQRGQPLSRFGVRYILAKYCSLARPTTPSFNGKRLHPHSVRHSTAVHLLKAGVDLVTISHWLGHASINTTNRYASVDLEMKREAISKVEPVLGHEPPTAPWKTDTSILDWLESL